MIVVGMSDPREKAIAKREIERLVQINAVVIRIMTAEQALKAERVVREAGNGRHR